MSLEITCDVMMVYLDICSIEMVVFMILLVVIIEHVLYRYEGQNTINPFCFILRM